MSVAVVYYNGAASVVDVSDPASPVIMPPWLGVPYSTGGGAIHGHTLYIGAFDLEVVDLSDPASPVVLEPLAGGVGTDALAVAEDRVLAATQKGLMAWDMNEPGEPAATSGEPGWVRAVAVEQDTAVVALGARGIAVVDLHEPMSPAVRAQIQLPGPVYGVAVASGLAVVHGHDHTYVVDLSDPSRPELDATLETRLEFQEDVVIDDDTLVLAESQVPDRGGIELFDLSDPYHPAALAWLGFDHYIRAVAIRDDLVLAAGGWYLEIIDISEPTTPVVIASLNVVPGGGTSWAEARDVVLTGDVALVPISQSGFFEIVDISDPSAPELRPRGSDQLFFTSAASGGSTVVAVSSPPYVADLSDPGQPVLRWFAPSREPLDVAVVGSYFIMAADPYFEVVHLACEPPRADFTWCGHGLHVWLEALGDYGPSLDQSYASGARWTLGDGHHAMAPDLHYTFPATGSYRVTLEVSNEWGSETITKTVTARDPAVSRVRSVGGRYRP